MSTPVQVTDDSFEQDVIQSDIPAVVDFWAVWCTPCKMIAPIVEEIADEYEGQLQVVKLDVDGNTQTAMQYGVMGIPTLILFKGGAAVEQLTGLMPKAAILSKIEPYL